MDNGTSFDIQWPEYRSKLIPTEGFEIQLPHDKPNWWWRIWQYVFFGFKWEDVKADGQEVYTTNGITAKAEA